MTRTVVILIKELAVDLLLSAPGPLLSGSSHCVAYCGSVGLWAAGKDVEHGSESTYCTNQLPLFNLDS